MVAQGSDIAAIHVGARGTGPMEAVAVLRPVPAASGSTLIFLRFPHCPVFQKAARERSRSRKWTELAGICSNFHMRLLHQARPPDRSKLPPRERPKAPPRVHP